MSRAICPTCGADLELSSFGTLLCCFGCGWNSARGGGISGSPSGACESFAKLIPSPAEAQHLFSSILNLQKPRALKWNSAFTVRAVFAGTGLGVAIVLGGLAVALARNGHVVSGVSALALVIVVALFNAAPFLRDLSKWHLLQQGEVTVGRVVYQFTKTGPWSGGSGDTSRIFYAFVDKANRAFVGRGADYSNNIGEGAAVVVFYDALDPNRNVSPDCCYLTVVLPPS